MDKYKITFKCKKQPKPTTGLAGFEADRLYVGRTFNGLYEVTPQWGKGGQNKLIGRAVFEEYFEIVNQQEGVQNQIESHQKTF